MEVFAWLSGIVIVRAIFYDLKTFDNMTIFQKI